MRARNLKEDVMADPTRGISDRWTDLLTIMDDFTTYQMVLEIHWDRPVRTLVTRLLQFFAHHDHPRLCISSFFTSLFWRLALEGVKAHVPGPECVLLSFMCSVPGICCHDIYLRRITSRVRKLY